MEWNEKLQNIIDYVENHLQRDEEPINVQEISQMAECSYTFFQKVFSYMNGVSFAEYIRYRKLTLAGYDIKSTNMKVVDISYKYGYESPTSFTKAFQLFHGVSPKEARMIDAKLRVYPKMQVSLKQQYTWRIERKASFRFIGKSMKMSCANNAHHQTVLEFWNQCQMDGTYAQLISLDTGIPHGLFGLFGEYDSVKNEIEYSIMVISQTEIPQGMREMNIPETSWAIFDCHGPIPQAIQNGWKYLQEEWLVQYPFQHAACPELEWYSSGNVYDQNYLSQIWIPIKEEE